MYSKQDKRRGGGMLCLPKSNKRTAMVFQEGAHDDETTATRAPLTLHDAAPFDPLQTSSAYHVYQAELALFQCKSLLSTPAHWKKVLKHRRSGVMVHMQKPDKVPIFRGQAVFHGFSPHSIFYVISMRRLWDCSFEDGHLIENLNDTTSLTYETTQKNRDLCLVETLECRRDGSIYFACTSVETPKVPPFKGRMRGHLQLLGWALEPVATGTRVTYFVQEAIKGWMSGLTKKSLARRPLAIAAIHDYLKTKSTYIPLNEKWRSPSRPSIRHTLTSCDSVTTDHSTSMTSLYPVHRHTAARDAMLVRLHQLFDKDAGWKHASDVHGLQCYTKDNYIRTDGFIRGQWHPEQICAMILCPDTRQKWDSQWQHGKIVERFSQRDYLMHWVLDDEQDMVVLCHIEREAEHLWIASTTVVDGQVRSVDGLHRVPLDLYAWRVSLKRAQQQVAVSLVTHASLSPWTPMACAMSVMKLQASLSSSGCPPFIRRVSGKIIVEHFDSDQRHYAVSWIVQHHAPPAISPANWCTVVCLDDRLFNQGYTIDLQPKDTTSLKTIGKALHIYSSHPAMDGQIIQLQVHGVSQPKPPSPRPSLVPVPSSVRTSSLITSSSASIHTTFSVASKSASIPPPRSRPSPVRVEKSKKKPIAVSPPSTVVLPAPVAAEKLLKGTGGVLVQRTNQHLIHVTDDLTFNGKQLLAILFMMIMAYYLGKACSC
ncbi:hypothetical protein BC940DRAFT_331950 [Gongronella butleri]|nr:hypothetical protein BC940DRAFT_331950 [Gongronella butleri]